MYISASVQVSVCVCVCLRVCLNNNVVAVISIALLKLLGICSYFVVVVVAAVTIDALY